MLKIRTHILFGLLLAYAGTGVSYAQTTPDPRVEKFEKLIQNVEQNYTDSINTDAIYEEVLKLVLKELDPHSRYFNKTQADEVNRRLDSSFDGIGITYVMLRDTLYILSVNPDGPAKNAGIKAGDRIIEVDNETIAGVKMNTENIHKLIGGKRGSDVKITIKRRGTKQSQTLTVTRDKIIVKSVETAYMASPEIGYLKLEKFTSNSADDVESALNALKEQGAKHLIFDLRNNTGGYLNNAVKISEEFLASGQLIVYTEGENSERVEYKAHGGGLFTEGRVAVLVNGQSASASEIVSGALQDWDRAVIIGQKTYGKGLVQRPYYFDDGSMMRLTIARYYTPTGRCIQKPYEVNKSIVSKENLDSIEFKTLTNKRIVSSAGGILPDILIDSDTTRYPKLYREWMQKHVVTDFVHSYVDKKRTHLLTVFPDFQKFNQEFSPDKELITSLVKFSALSKDLEHSTVSIIWSDKNVKIHIKALIAGDLWGVPEYQKIMNENSPEYLKAVECLTEASEYSKILAEK